MWTIVKVGEADKRNSVGRIPTTQPTRESVPEGDAQLGIMFVPFRDGFSFAFTSGFSRRYFISRFQRLFCLSQPQPGNQQAGQ
jgi:hypothetical protein